MVRWFGGGCWVLGGGGVRSFRLLLEYSVRVQENTRPYKLATTTDEHFDPTKHQQGWRFDLVLETRSHPQVPAGHPQFTGAWFDRKAVDGPQPNHCAHAAVCVKHRHSRAIL